MTRLDMNDFIKQLADEDTVEVYLIRASDTTLQEGLICGDERAIRFATLIGQFLKTITSKDTPRPRCLCCEKPFKRTHPPWSVIVLMPFSADSGERFYASVSGLCNRCTQKPDDDLFNLTRKLMDSIVRVESIVRVKPTRH